MPAAQSVGSGRFSSVWSLGVDFGHVLVILLVLVARDFLGWILTILAAGLGRRGNASLRLRGDGTILGPLEFGR
jgi:hypothetical protein